MVRFPPETCCNNCRMDEPVSSCSSFRFILSCLIDSLMTSGIKFSREFPRLIDWARDNSKLYVRTKEFSVKTHQTRKIKYKRSYFVLLQLLSTLLLRPLR